jgi:forkhead box protein K
VERSAGERGKGFYWTVEADCERMFEEQEARAATSAAGGGKDSKVGGRKGKSAAALDPPFKRSVRGEPKGAPLPPPLTSTPLVFKPQQAAESASGTSVKVEPSSTASPGPADSASVQPTSTPSTSTSPQIKSGASHAELSTSSPSVSSIPLIPASVVLPIIVGPVPASHPSAASSDVQSTSSAATSHLSTPPIVLHENQLILNPTIFSHLTPAQLRELEALGAQKALEILQGHIVRFLKERIKTEGRARGRSRGKRSSAGTQAEKREKPPPSTELFTTTPLPTRSAPPPMDALLPTPSPSGGSDAQAEADTSPPSPIVIVDDDEPSDGPAPKRRRLDAEDVPVTAVAV